MLLNNTIDPRDSSSCQLRYEEAGQWMHATWSGFVDPVEARRGAETYLRYAAQMPCARLLNDNSQLRGPWFDSMEWLRDIWVPQANSLGLRYVAHVVQNDRHADLLTSQLLLNLPFELQIFQDVADARHWLRQQ